MATWCVVHCNTPELCCSFAHCVLQTATHWLCAAVLQCVANCSALQRVILNRVLQCVAVRCSMCTSFRLQDLDDEESPNRYCGGRGNQFFFITAALSCPVVRYVSLLNGVSLLIVFSL